MKITTAIFEYGNLKKAVLLVGKNNAAIHSIRFRPPLRVSRGGGTGPHRA